MNLKNWAEKKMKRFSVYDFAVFKTTIVLFGIIIGAYIASFVKQYIWYFVLFAAIGYAYLVYLMFRK